MSSQRTALSIEQGLRNIALSAREHEKTLHPPVIAPTIASESHIRVFYSSPGPEDPQSGVGRINEEQLTVVVFNTTSEEGSDNLTLRRASPSGPGAWKCKEQVNIAADSQDAVLIILQDESEGDVGHLCLTSEDLKCENGVLERSFALVQGQDGGPLLTFACTISSANRVADDTSLPPTQTVQKGDVQGSCPIEPASQSADPESPLDEIDILLEQANSSISTFATTSDIEDLSKAISTFEEIVSITPTDDPRRAQAATSLTPTLFKKYELTNNVEDLSRVIQQLEDSLPVLSLYVSSRGLAYSTGQLSRLYSRRHQRTNRSEDLDTAIRWGQDAVDLDHANDHLRNNTDPNDGHSACLRVNNLTNLLMQRAVMTSSLQDMDRSIDNDQKASDVMHSSDEHRLIISTTLAESLYYRFERTGDITDMSRAITTQQAAIDMAPNDWEHRHRLLRGLMLCLWGRFDRRGNAEDLHRSISTMEEVLRLANPRSGEQYAKRLVEMGVLLSTRFLMTDDLGDITRAIAYGEEALTLVEKESSAYQWGFANLATFYGRKFKASQDVRDLDKAIEAVEIHLKDNVHPTWHHNMADLLSTRYEQTKDPQDFEASITHRRRAVDLTPVGHPSRTDRLRKLGVLLRKRFERSTNPDSKDIFGAVDCFSSAARDTAGIPFHRLHAACLWSLTSRRYSRNRAASLRPFGYSITLLAQLPSLGQTPRERYKNLGGQSDWLSLAVAVALTESKSAHEVIPGVVDGVTLAIEWLEQGRCLVWSQISRLRTPADLVRERNAELAERFESVSSQLEGSSAPGVSMQPNMTKMEEEVRRRVELAKEWDGLVEKIRRLDGLENFLLPIKASDIIKRLPGDGGTVVMFNLHASRCDALALRKGEEVMHIPLTEFTLEKASALLSLLRKSLRAKGVRMRAADFVGRGLTWEMEEEEEEAPILYVLGELWRCVIRPIFDVLGYFIPHENSDDRPRVWWCPTGPLAFLPIHAAGMYEDGTPPGFCVHDYVISSYTPTISVLLDKFKTQSTKDSSETKILLISQPDTSGLSPIPGTAREVENLHQIMFDEGIDSQILSRSEATTSSVRTAMKTHSWAHFACHAVQDVEDPMKSGVHLHDGRLEFVELMGENIPTTEHAFLSACQTCTGDEKLADEAVHLAAGMLAMGYRGVVATMWSINDGYGPEVALGFYRHVVEKSKSKDNVGRKGRLECSESARALDSATRELRKELGSGEDALLAWVPYAHFGV